MRFRLPKACAAVTHAGASFAPDPNGCIEAPEAALEELATHEIYPMPDETPPAPRVRAAHRKEGK